MMFAKMIEQLTVKPKVPKTGAQRQREYQERFVAKHGIEAWREMERERRRKLRAKRKGAV